MSHHDHGSHHVIPLKVYLTVFSILIVATAITVYVATLDFGILNTPIALFVATFKATMVLLFFMHLKYDDATNKVVVGSALFFVFLLFFFSALDIFTRIVQTSTL